MKYTKFNFGCDCAGNLWGAYSAPRPLRVAGCGKGTETGKERGRETRRDRQDTALAGR